MRLLQVVFLSYGLVVSAFPHMMSLVPHGLMEPSPIIGRRQDKNCTVGLTRKHLEWKPPGDGDGG